MSGDARQTTRPPPSRQRSPAPARGTAPGNRGSRGKPIAFIALLGLVLLGTLLAVILGDLVRDDGTLVAWLDALGPWSGVVIVLLMIAHCFVPFPAEIVALAAGASHGLIAGTALVWSGAMLGAGLSFAIARMLGRRAVESLLPHRHRTRLDAWTDDRGTLALLVCRLMPVIAFNLVNYGAGLTRVGWWTFLWTTAIGILPLTTLMVWLGTRMAELNWPLLLAVSSAGMLMLWAGHRIGRQRGWFR